MVRRGWFSLGVRTTVSLHLDARIRSRGWTGRGCVAIVVTGRLTRSLSRALFMSIGRGRLERFWGGARLVVSVIVSETCWRLRALVLRGGQGDVLGRRPCPAQEHVARAVEASAVCCKVKARELRPPHAHLRQCSGRGSFCQVRLEEARERVISLRARKTIVSAEAKGVGAP
jgi:hypothetical protein